MVSSLQVYGKLFFPSSLEYGCVITAHDEELHMEKVFKLLKAHGPHFQYIYSRLRKAKGIFFCLVIIIGEHYNQKLCTWASETGGKNQFFGKTSKKC